MTVQIAVRLPDDLVAFLDHEVEEGQARSRAEIVAEALEHERRRRAALVDAAILTSLGPEDDLDELVDWASSTPSSQQ